MSNIKYAAIILVIVLATVGVVYAATTLNSNSVTVNPQPTPTPATLTLTSNTTTPYIGEKVLLTATLSPAQPGIAVDFKLAGDVVATVGTNTAGVATYTTPTLTDATARVYTATCVIP